MSGRSVFYTVKMKKQRVKLLFPATFIFKLAELFVNTDKINNNTGKNNSQDSNDDVYFSIGVKKIGHFNSLFRSLCNGIER